VSPPKLTPRLPRLPPILHSPYQNPTPNCSKGPRGLSVLLRETSIFTRSAISPGLWLRQWPSRCAIRAGRNFALSAVSSGADYAFTSRESSDDLFWHIPALPARIHGASESHDLSQTRPEAMLTPSHPFADVCKLLEVSLLSGADRIRTEVRDDRRQE
jgi:hypothetical protein